MESRSRPSEARCVVCGELGAGIIGCQHPRGQWMAVVCDEHLSPMATLLWCPSCRELADGRAAVVVH